MTDDELTKAVAVEVMGWTIGSAFTYRDKNGELIRDVRGLVLSPWTFEPLHDMNHCWMVVERMVDLGFFFKHSFGYYGINKEISHSLSFAQTEKAVLEGLQSMPIFSKHYSKNFNRAILEAALEAVRGGKDD